MTLLGTAAEHYVAVAAVMIWASTSIPKACIPTGWRMPS